MHPLLRANRNTVWGGLIVESLVRCGLKRAIISPGSRSTPITLAFALDDRVECTPILDERSAAFFALGCAKLTGEPTALVCTSGTAAANYLPAVIEAHYSGTPLIVLTADRPPELRDCGAGQTIDQVKIFGDYVHYYHELCLPPMSKQLNDRHAYLVRTITHAYSIAKLHEPGPIHLNVPFRDPLAPIEGPLGGPFPAINKSRLPLSKPFATVSNPLNADDLPFADRDDLLVVAGPPNEFLSKENALAAVRLCAKFGWPLLADTASSLRGFAREHECIVGTYDSLLRDPIRRQDLRPGALLLLGQLPTSKVLRSFLQENLKLPAWHLGSNPLNVNAGYHAVETVSVQAQDLIIDDGERKDLTEYASLWHKAENAERRRLNKALTACNHLFEGRLSDLLARTLPAKTPVFVASSMPIRDFEYFWPVNRRAHHLVVNRGANGIDGTLSTAMGVAQSSKRSAVLVTGDLAFLHDKNGLLAADHLKGGLTVFLINNNGGGIFEHLPIADFDPPFEEFFATPQSVDFAKLANAHNLEYHCPKSWDQVTALAKKLPKNGVRIIELKTDRKADSVLRKSILNAS
ncbi:MAG: 2-succinyl-5-enolpyruvyl-6-hydroxy-3-cyclohexene-1-carboxylic-acid synthase [Verrucomicrobiota bacterium]